VRPQTKSDIDQPGEQSRRGAWVPNLRHLLGGFALCVLAVLAYANSFQAGFSWDNQFLILQDTRLREATSQNIGLIFQHTYWWPTGEAGIYRPLTTLSYLLNYAILGDGGHPGGYHSINLILHVVNVLLVYVLGLRLIQRFWPAVSLAAVWSVHPVLTESVTNIVGRADLLAGIAILGGFLMYLKSADVDGARKIPWLAGLMAITAVGVYSKESAVTIVGVMALYELVWWGERRRGRSLLYGCLAVIPPIAVMLLERYSVLASSPPAEWPFPDNPIAGAAFWTGKVTALKVIPRYLGILAWPARLSVDYSFSEIPLVSGSGESLVLWITVVAAIAAGVVLYRANRTAFFLIGFAVVTFSPTSNLLLPIGTIMAERFLYLPSIGLLGCFVLAIYGIGDRIGLRAFAPVLLCLVTAGLGARTWMRNQDWTNDLSLVTASLRAAPNSYKLHKVLASLIYAADQSHVNLDLVTAEVERALSILNPLPDERNDADTYRWAGGFYLGKGDLLRQSAVNGDARAAETRTQSYHRALEVLQRCISISKTMDERQREKLAGRDNGRRPVASSEPEAYRLLSAVYLRLAEPEKAAQAADTALSLDPLRAEAYHQEAQVLMGRGEGEQAAVTLMQGFFLTSDDELRQDLVNLYRGGLDPQGCALVQGRNGPVFNPECETVHRHICAASVPVVKTQLAGGRPDAAQSQKAMFIGQFGCPVEPLQQVR
jgi:protein O-mannosyl-transferase